MQNYKSRPNGFEYQNNLKGYNMTYLCNKMGNSKVARIALQQAELTQYALLPVHLLRATWTEYSELCAVVKRGCFIWLQLIIL